MPRRRSGFALRVRGFEFRPGMGFHDEAGFAMIEVAIGLTILAIGVLGMILGFDSSRRLSLVSERHATMAHVAQREIERLEGTAYSQLGLTSTPGTSSNRS